MLVKIVLIAVAIIAAILLIAAFRPADFRVSRSTTIAAPAAVAFSQVNTLSRWEAWSPWARVDPKMRQTYSGPAAGLGAVSEWNGNSQVGAGRMTITESRPYELIRLRLDFFKPFSGTNTAEFLFDPAGSQTRVTWTMTGRASFVPRLIGLFISMDAMIGREFARGLNDLKAVSENKTSR